MTPDRFDEQAATWDDNPRRMALTKAIAEAIQAAIPLDESMAMLDFGCGTGTLSGLLAARVGSIHAVDTSAGMIAELRRKLEASPELTRQITPAVLAPPLDQSLHGKWDLICSAMVLHHVEDATGTLGYLAGLLRPGGYLAIADLYSEDGSFHGEVKVPHNGFDPQKLVSLARQAGLTQTSVQTVQDFEKPTPEGELRKYSVFLLTARAG